MLHRLWGELPGRADEDEIKPSVRSLEGPPQQVSSLDRLLLSEVVTFPNSGVMDKTDPDH